MRALIVQGTGSGVGKTLIVAAFCRISNSYVTEKGEGIAYTQAFQAVCWVGGLNIPWEDSASLRNSCARGPRIAVIKLRSISNTTDFQPLLEDCELSCEEGEGEGSWTRPLFKPLVGKEVDGYKAHFSVVKVKGNYLFSLEDGSYEGSFAQALFENPEVRYALLKFLRKTKPWPSRAYWSSSFQCFVRAVRKRVDLQYLLDLCSRPSAS